MIVAAIALFALAPFTDQSSKVERARAFVELLLVHPEQASTLATSDAVLVAGDIGVSMAEFLATNKPPASWIGDCHVGHLKEDSNASAKMAADKDPPPWLKHGVPTFVEGTMSCTKVGKSANVQIMVVLSDDKVAMFGLDRVQ